MTVSEMMAEKKARKLALKNKPRVYHQVKAPLLVAMNDLAYKLKNNNLTMNDTYNLLLLLQHTFFIQSIDKEAGWNWLGIRYINNIKQAIESVLNSVIKNCVVTDEGYYATNKDKKITVYKQTRSKILWFILGTYDKTAQVLNAGATNKANGYSQKIAKHINYARDMLDMSLMVRNIPISKFLYQ